MTDTPLNSGKGDRLDLGGGVSIQPSWYETPEVVVGWILRHPGADGNECAGSAWLEGSRLATPGHSWKVTAGTPEHPLTLEPSFRCHCGFHGFVRDGKWVSA